MSDIRRCERCMGEGPFSLSGLCSKCRAEERMGPFEKKEPQPDSVDYRKGYAAGVAAAIMKMQEIPHLRRYMPPDPLAAAIEHVRGLVK